MKRWFLVLALLLSLGSASADNIVKTVVDGETILAADWNAEFLNIYADVTHSIAGTWTFTKAGTPITITPASAPAANTIIFDINNTGGTNLWSIDYEADVVRAGSEAWTVNDAGTVTTTTFSTLTHTTSGTAGTAFGIRNLYQLEDGAGNTDSAASIDVVWSDATSTSEDADVVFRQAKAGTIAENFRVSSTGTLTVGAAGAIVTTAGGDLTVQGPTSNGIIFKTNGSASRWAINSSGHLVPNDDNSYDIGVTGTNDVRAIYSGTLTLVTPLALTSGGTAKSLTAANGGIAWSDADSLEITAAGSSGQMLRSGGAATPAWSTPTWPNAATTTGAYLRADGTNFIQSTLILPNAATANQIVHATASDTYGGTASLTWDASTLLTNSSGSANATNWISRTGIDASGEYNEWKTQITGSTNWTAIRHVIAAANNSSIRFLTTTDNGSNLVSQFEIGADGELISTGTTFAALGTPANGTFIYCSDCTFADPCAGSGTGAIAKRLNGAWRCD